MQHFDVPQKVIDSRGPAGKLAMKYFFMRYKTLEKSNFPVNTRENGFCLLLLVISIALNVTKGAPENLKLNGVSIEILLGAIAIFISLFTTIVCTAPVIGRITPIHRWYLWFVHYPLFRLCEAIDWCTGTNKHGYIMHLTAPKLLGYGYVTPEQMDSMCSLAIVRNPYSRMVSIYGYNRFGESESFPTFVRRWKKLMNPYLERGEKEEWYTPCHLLPMFEFTHHNARQIVQSIVKQEELKYLKTKEGAQEAIKQDSSVANLPDIVRNALLGMPHANKRATGKKWHEYYDQETMDLTYEMYKQDFAVFNYDRAIPQRSDLTPPSLNRRDLMSQNSCMSRNSFVGQNGIRISQHELFDSVTSSVRKYAQLRSTLKSSLVSLNKDELLGGMVGSMRMPPPVQEAFREDSISSSGGPKKNL